MRAVNQIHLACRRTAAYDQISLMRRVFYIIKDGFAKNAFFEQINQASSIISSGYSLHTYKYVIVDEYYC